MRIRIRKIEYLSNPSLILYRFGGRREKSTFEPSSGGMGMRLKTAKTIFIITIYEEMSINASDTVLPKKRIIKPKIRAIRILANGPAREIMSSPHLLFFTLYGFHCTGLAQPNVNPIREVIIGTIKDPNKSRCFRGLIVSLP